MSMIKKILSAPSVDSVRERWAISKTIELHNEGLFDGLEKPGRYRIIPIGMGDSLDKALHAGMSLLPFPNNRGTITSLLRRLDNNSNSIRLYGRHGVVGRTDKNPTSGRLLASLQTGYIKMPELGNGVSWDHSIADFAKKNQVDVVLYKFDRATGNERSVRYYSDPASEPNKNCIFLVYSRTDLPKGGSETHFDLLVPQSCYPYRSASTLTQVSTAPDEAVSGKKRTAEEANLPRSKKQIIMDKWRDQLSEQADRQDGSMLAAQTMLGLKSEKLDERLSWD
jgi:hypothetical protein